MWFDYPSRAAEVWIVDEERENFLPGVGGFVATNVAAKGCLSSVHVNLSAEGS